MQIKKVLSDPEGVFTQCQYRGKNQNMAVSKSFEARTEATLLRRERPMRIGVRMTGPLT